MNAGSGPVQLTDLGTSHLCSLDIRIDSSQVLHSFFSLLHAFMLKANFELDFSRGRERPAHGPYKAHEINTS